MKHIVKAILAAACVVSSITVTAPAFSDVGIKAGHFLDREVLCLARAIYHEAGSESVEGKLAVAQVVVNRSEDSRFPNSICGVVSQQTAFAGRKVCQFSWFCTAKRTSTLNNAAYYESMDIATQVLVSGTRLAKVKDALYFHAAHASPNWRKKKVTRIGNHIFYADHKS